jgi:hypothetical protein
VGAQAERDVVVPQVDVRVMVHLLGDGGDVADERDGVREGRRLDVHLEPADGRLVDSRQVRQGGLQVGGLHERHAITVSRPARRGNRHAACRPAPVAPNR